MVKIDLKDRKIIYELSENARQTNSAIAKKVGLSPQLVDYRIKRIERLNIIKGYYTCMDISKIGYASFRVYIKLQNLNEEKEREMINDLKNNPNVTLVATCDGMWDLYLGIWGKNIFQFNKIFNEINNKYSYYFSKKSIILNTKILAFTRKYLAPSKNIIDYSTQEWGGEVAEVTLDKIDFQILLTIAQNARMSDSEIGEKMGISRKVVAYHLKKLIDQKIIWAFRPTLNADILNFKLYKMFLRIQSFTPEKEKKLITFLNRHPNVITVNFCTGEWELELVLESPSIDVNRDLIRQLKNKFTDVIRDLEVMLIYKSHKFNYLPAGLKEIQAKLNKK